MVWSWIICCAKPRTRGLRERSSAIRLDSSSKVSPMTAAARKLCGVRAGTAAPAGAIAGCAAAGVAIAIMRTARATYAFIV
jgi:hypothetical protein